MSMWTAIALIAMAGIAAEAYRHHSKAKYSKLDQQFIDGITRRLDALESELKSRIETLERIVTDRKEDLRRQFDQFDKTA